MEAPPKQLASALEGLNRAIRLIADVRSGADALLEAFDSADSLRVIASALGALGAEVLCVDTAKELESAGVFVGAQQRYQDNQPWGLQVPVVCPDGALVAYSWKRQIAGQAAASAVDRTKLALRSFCEQKKRFLPHMAKAAAKGDEEPRNTPAHSLPDVVKRCLQEAPGMSITPHSRLAKSPSCQVHDAALLHVAIPGVLRAVISLLPAGSPNPDAIAIYSPNEPHMDAWGASTHQTFQRISECATNAMHHFTRVANASATLLLLLTWLFSYRSLFAKPCKQCRRLLAPDGGSNVPLPPTHRTYADGNEHEAYHPGCVAL
ncbi:mediator of RNA polymerase II transcription subunit 27-like [Selaginella moellendorffii]|uniref:mediator of RNA polymerase II transcription subunit 27-like n=1 Tax=Selaginella moellendorffii TaxID=88036 RepID=UPI000D1CC016|nr:mediator of RNA polymerase II transcription subunit 27-like [Selaginella moellendorffii]|eukprot:XP_024523480.1 mediator of RNA polymerase II transcription subunit 27-like [Selaginella moellendorffii]